MQKGGKAATRRDNRAYPHNPHGRRTICRAPSGLSPLVGAFSQGGARKTRLPWAGLGWAVGPHATAFTLTVLDAMKRRGLHMDPQMAQVYEWLAGMFGA